MKHLKIMTCLLLLGSMAPTTALCTGKDASKRGKEKGCDRPYSEAMYVKRQGGDLYISAKLDEGRISPIGSGGACSTSSTRSTA